MFRISLTWILQAPHLKMSRTKLTFSSKSTFCYVPYYDQCTQVLVPTLKPLIRLSSFDLDYGNPTTLIITWIGFLASHLILHQSLMLGWLFKKKIWLGHAPAKQLLRTYPTSQFPINFRKKTKCCNRAYVRITELYPLLSSVKTYLRL